MFKVAAVVGTRPEAVKLAPVVLALKQRQDLVCHVCSTGQHRQILDQILEVFGLRPEVDLGLMKPNQTLAELTARAMVALDGYYKENKPDLVLVQGDTTTVFVATLAAFYHRIPVGHVEAGLRTWNLLSPWPEEANRVLVSRLATVHFAPTEWSRDNLLKEGVPSERIVVTGNTVIDALLLARQKTQACPPRIASLPDLLQPGRSDGPRVVLLTGHRRESFGQGFENICNAVAELTRRFPDVHFVYPMHLNPNVRAPVDRILRPGHAANLHLIEPLDYLAFVALMDRSTLILTDSGGVQEEAPSLGKPVLVMRDTTERPEAVAAGTTRLVGTSFESIVSGVTELLTDEKAYRGMIRVHNPYGDGKASLRIEEYVAALARDAKPKA